MEYKNEFNVLSSMSSRLAKMEFHIICKNINEEDCEDDKKILNALTDMFFELANEFGYKEYLFGCIEEK